MKELLVSLSLITACFVGGTAHASEYGCKVLLCLANPKSNGGPMGVTECQPPISQLYHDLAHGDPFPKCDLADGNDSSQNYASQVSNYYDPCPTGTKPAPAGQGVVEGTSAAQRLHHQLIPRGPQVGHASRLGARQSRASNETADRQRPTGRAIAASYGFAVKLVLDSMTSRA